MVGELLQLLEVFRGGSSPHLEVIHLLLMYFLNCGVPEFGMYHFDKFLPSGKAVSSQTVAEEISLLIGPLVTCPPHEAGSGKHNLKLVEGKVLPKDLKVHLAIGQEPLNVSRFSLEWFRVS